MSARIITLTSAVFLGLAALFFKSTILIFAAGLLLAAGGFLALGKRDGLLVWPLLFSSPIFLQVFPVSGPLRLLFVASLIGLFLWCVEDSFRRKKGAPVSISRLELFFFSGLFLFSSVSFAALFDVPRLSFLLLAAITAVVFSGTYILRSAAERSRAATSLVPRALDGVLVGILTGEIFVGLSFLPLSPMTMAAALVILSWAMVAVLLAARVGQIAVREIFRIAATATFLIVMLFLGVPWSSSS